MNVTVDVGAIAQVIPDTLKTIYENPNGIRIIYNKTDRDDAINAFFENSDEIRSFNCECRKHGYDKIYKDGTIKDKNLFLSFCTCKKKLKKLIDYINNFILYRELKLIQIGCKLCNIYINI